MQTFFAQLAQFILRTYKLIRKSITIALTSCYNLVACELCACVCVSRVARCTTCNLPLATLDKMFYAFVRAKLAACAFRMAHKSQVKRCNQPTPNPLPLYRVCVKKKAEVRQKKRNEGEEREGGCYKSSPVCAGARTGCDAGRGYLRMPCFDALHS